MESCPASSWSAPSIPRIIPAQAENAHTHPSRTLNSSRTPGKTTPPPPQTAIRNARNHNPPRSSVTALIHRACTLSSPSPHRVYKGCTPDAPGMHKRLDGVQPVSTPCAPLVHAVQTWSGKPVVTEMGANGVGGEVLVFSASAPVMLPVGGNGAPADACLAPIRAMR